MLSYDFSRKVAIVTGGGSGMGRAIAIRFALAGAKVMIGDVIEDEANETAQLIKANGGDAAFLKTDISVSEQVEALVSETARRFGRVDFCCNPAAINLEFMGAEVSEDDFDRVIDVNLRGTCLCIKHQVRQIQKQGTGGAIVNFSSLNAYRSPSPYQNAYVAAKSGVLSLSRLAAIRHSKEGIRVNTIVPGAIDTPMLRKAFDHRDMSIEEMAKNYSLTGLAGKPEDIAEAAIWLCSDYWSYVIGVELRVDGGALLS